MWVPAFLAIRRSETPSTPSNEEALARGYDGPLSSVA